MERFNRDSVIKSPTSVKGQPTDTGTIEATHMDLVTRRIDGEVWILKAIEAKRVQRTGVVEFLIRFNGPFYPSWEPREKIPKELISRYLVRRRQADRMKSRHGHKTLE